MNMDVARWGLGVKFPTKVSAISGHFMFDDDQETPNTLNCAFDLNDTAASWRRCSPRVVPVAHGRAGFGGGLFSTGIILLLVDGQARLTRSLVQSSL